VVGLRGYGKSTKVVSLAREFPRVLYYDSLGDDYTDGVICRDGGVLEKFWRGVYRLPSFRIVYRPVDPISEFARICELVWECGDLLFVVDEVQLYFRGGVCCPEFTKIVTGGRHAGIDLIGVTQAPKKLGELLRSQAHEWYVFAVREPDQAAYLSERLAGVDKSCFETMEKFRYVHYLDGQDPAWIYYQEASGETRKLYTVNHALQTPAPGPGGDPGEHADVGGSLERGPSNGA
jgi:hypothetical protein